MENQRLLIAAVTAFFTFQEGTMSRAWSEVTLSLLEALHHPPYPREERRKGFVLDTDLFINHWTPKMDVQQYN